MTRNRNTILCLALNALITLGIITVIGPSGMASATPGTSDGECFVSTGGSDLADGLSRPTAKATVNACVGVLTDGGQVRIGRGTFTSASPITYKPGLSLLGSGPGIQNIAGGSNGTRLVYTGTGDAIRGNIASTDWISSVKINGLTIDTNGSTNKGANAIHVWNAHDIELSDLVINGNYTNAIDLDSNAINSDGITVRNVRVEPAGSGRRIENAINVPKNGTVPAENNVVMIERLTCNIGAGDGGATTKGNACIQVDGVVRQMEIHTSVFMGANWGLNVVNAGSAANVWMFAPHVEGNLGKLLNVNPQDNWVNLFGLIGDQVGQFPRNGLIVAADGVIFSGTDNRPALQVAPSSYAHVGNLVEFQNGGRAPVFAWNTQP